MSIMLIHWFRIFMMDSDFLILIQHHHVIATLTNKNIDELIALIEPVNSTVDDSGNDLIS